MTSKQESTVNRLKGQGFEFVYKTGDLVLLEKQDMALYVQPNGLYFKE
jgi:hypothetical protein|tara:strand:- start:7661 stop:7804 length:144 start_codon:yes stop_codon:yes gene_type:complete